MASWVKGLVSKAALPINGIIGMWESAKSHMTIRGLIGTWAAIRTFARRALCALGYRFHRLLRSKIKRRGRQAEDPFRGLQGWAGSSFLAYPRDRLLARPTFP